MAYSYEEQIKRLRRAYSLAVETREQLIQIHGEEVRVVGECEEAHEIKETAKTLVVQVHGFLRLLEELRLVRGTSETVSCV